MTLKVQHKVEDWQEDVKLEDWQIAEKAEGNMKTVYQLAEELSLEKMELPERNTFDIICIEHFVPFNYYMDTGRVLAEQHYIVWSYFESYW